MFGGIFDFILATALENGTAVRIESKPSTFDYISMYYYGGNVEKTETEIFGYISELDGYFAVAHDTYNGGFTVYEKTDNSKKVILIATRWF